MRLTSSAANRKFAKYLSHLSLLFRHGSQLIAFRARFVGGRPSLFCSPDIPDGGERLRTTPAVVDLRGFGRGAVGEVAEVVGGLMSGSSGGNAECGISATKRDTEPKEEK